MMKKGFTLAEMLITLGIIAVIATILFPILKSVLPHEEMMKYKKAYYITERVVAELVNDDDLYPEVDGPNNFLANTVEVSPRGQGPYRGETKFCELFAAKINPSSEIDCTVHNTFADGVTFTTSDAIAWILPITNFELADVSQPIVVDVNGNKGPNCFYNPDGSCQNPDRLIISIFQNGRVVADQQKGIEYLNRTKVSRDE